MITHPSRQHPNRIIPLLTLLSGNSVFAALTLMRNIFAARLIGADQFGNAAALAIVATAIEMMTNLGLQQMIVRDRRGDAPRFQASLHSVQLGLGIIGACILYLFAPVLASFFNMTTQTWAFRLLAFLPLAGGAIHLDPFRYQRAGRFGTSIAISLGPALLALMMIWPLYQKFGDFRVLLVASFIQGFGTLMMSHLVAERRFTLQMEPRHLPSIWAFGGPMVLNGILLLGVFHGEKILVAHLSGPTDLAILAMGFTLTLTPALILGKSLQTYALPKLSKLDSRSGFQTQAQHLMLLCLGIALAMTAILSSLGAFVPRLLGPDFATLQNIFPMLAVLHGLRLARSGPTIVALAKGCTLNAAIGNMPRIAALPIAYLWLAEGGDLAGLLWIAIIAEATGLALAFMRSRQALNGT